MPTNNIKLFDENKVNMLTDVDYNTNAQRINGVQSGVASSKLQNKTLYQTSLISYAIAQFMNEMGFDASDSGAVSTFVNNLSSSIKKPADSDVKYVSQSLTDAQKTQARANIAAAPDGFGLGKGEAHEVVPDCNDVRLSGLYIMSNVTTNYPTLIHNGEYSLLRVSARTAGEILQEVFCIGLEGQYDFSAVRSYGNTGVWSPWEYVNPALNLGVEYRTTERYLGKPVYVQAVNFGTLPNANTKSVTWATPGVVLDVLSAEATSNLGEPIGLGASLSGTEITANKTTLYIKSSGNYSDNTAVFRVKYTKTTD